jgi:MFS family permease
LTVSELFPDHVRGLAIALFYAIGTAAGALAPALFGAIVHEGDPVRLFGAYAGAAGLMIAAAIVARIYGVASEGRSLESLAAAP